MASRLCALYCAHHDDACDDRYFAAAAIFLKHRELLTQINIGPLVKQPVEALLGLVTLGHQLGYNNILSMYAVMLLMTPLLLLLARISLSLMVAVSGTVWLLSGLYGVAPINYPTGGVWFLNPLSGSSCLRSVLPVSCMCVAVIKSRHILR